MTNRRKAWLPENGGSWFERELREREGLEDVPDEILAPDFEDQRQAEQHIRSRIDAMAPEELDADALEDYPGERRDLAELYGEAGAVSILTDRARSQLYDAASAHQGRLTRADYQRAKDANAEMARRTDDALARFQRMHPELSGRPYAEIEAAAREAMEGARQLGLDPAQYFGTEDHVNDTAAILGAPYEPVPSASGYNAGRTAGLTSGGFAAPAPRASDDEKGEDMLDQIRRVQRASGLF